MLRERAVKPIGEWRIVDPRMLRADVIRHLVLNDLYTERMRLLDQLAQRRQIAEAIFDGVVIDRVIAVVVSVWTPGLVAAIHAIPVVVPGSQPECSDAEIFQIRKLLMMPRRSPP